VSRSPRRVRYSLCPEQQQQAAFLPMKAIRPVAVVPPWATITAVEMLKGKKSYILFDIPTGAKLGFDSEDIITQ